ncbi:MAG: tyrosine-type recombinase/integrase [Halobacteriota archaeon]
MSEGILRISRTLLTFHNRVINITKGKGGKQQRVLLDPETVSVLSDYISKEHVREDQPIFGIKRCQVHTLVKKYGKQVGMDIHPHTFRHSFAIHMARHGSDLRRLQLLLGRSTINTTQVYLRFNDQDLRELYDRIPF